MSRGGARWAIFVHDPDGDMGYGRIVGAFKDGALAVRKANQITERSRVEGTLLECIVLPLEPGGTGAGRIVEAVLR